MMDIYIRVILFTIVVSFVFQLGIPSALIKERYRYNPQNETIAEYIDFFNENYGISILIDANPRSYFIMRDSLYVGKGSKDEDVENTLIALKNVLPEYSRTALQRLPKYWIIVKDIQLDSEECSGANCSNAVGKSNSIVLKATDNVEQMTNTIHQEIFHSLSYFFTNREKRVFAEQNCLYESSEYSGKKVSNVMSMIWAESFADRDDPEISSKAQWLHQKYDGVFLNKHKNSDKSIHVNIDSFFARIMSYFISINTIQINIIDFLVRTVKSFMLISPFK